MEQARAHKALWGLLLVVVALSLALAGSVLRSRYQFEQKQNRVALVLDYATVARLARLTGERPGDWLRRAHGWGYRDLAIEEDTLESLESQGRLQVQRGAEMLAFRNLGVWMDNHPIDPERLYLVSGDGELLDRIEEGFRLRFLASWQRFLVRTPAGETFQVLETPASLGENAIKIGVGFGKASIPRAARRFRLFPRFNNTLSTPDLLAWKLQTLRTVRPAGCLIFSGVEVPGFPGEIRESADLLGTLPQGVCLAEQAEMDGLDQFKAMYPQARKLHTIAEEEMKKFSHGKFVQRFVRAARERNVRVLYVRPVLFAPKDQLLGLNRRYLKAIVGGLKSEGLRVGPPSPFEGFTPDATAQRMMLAGLLCLCGVWLMLLAPFAWRVLVGAGVLAGALVMGGLAGGLNVRLLLGLLAVTAAGTLPILALARQRWWGWGRGVPGAVAAWVLVSATSLAAGLLTAGTFSSAEAMTGVFVFKGIKLALFAPLGLVALGWMFQPDPETTSGSPFLKFLSSPPTRGELLGALLLAGAGALLVLRSGNESGATTGFELAARDSLEMFWGVRPRTKEFLVGHPALLLGLWLVQKDRRSMVAWGLLALGAAGQASLINTFCHFHTPINLSLWRGLLGLGLGGGIGLLLVATLAGLEKMWEKKVG